MLTKTRKKMGPEERRATSRRLLRLAGQVVPLAVRIALDLADGTLDHPEAVAELVSVVQEIGDVLGEIKRDRADADDTPDEQEG